MITALALTLLLTSGAGTETAAGNCRGVVDRTAACPNVDATPLAVVDDAKAPVTPQRTFGTDLTATDVAGALGLSAAGLAVGGSALLAISFSRPDDVTVQDATLYSAVGLFAWAGLAASSALAVVVFDPTDGSLRLPLYPEDER
jgi:hypothetical protein